MQAKNAFDFPSFGIALNATTPVPAAGAGATIYSTITNTLLTWDGTKWAAGTASSGVSYAQAMVLALIY